MRVCACVRVLSDTTFTDYGEGAVEAILKSGARDVQTHRNATKAPQSTGPQDRGRGHVPNALR
jgi:hypothetical protein